MELRNIHFTADEETTTPPQAQSGTGGSPVSSPSTSSSSSPLPPPSSKLRLRRVKVSPHQEYALRPGAVAPISDALAALICSRKGRAEIGPKGITVERKDIGGRRIYHHPDSRLCNDLSQRERKIFYVLNALKPDIIHLLDDTGRYIESLPEKFQPGVLNNAEQKREYDDQRRQLGRVARHLQELHGETTKDAIAARTHNAEQMKGIVQVLGTNTPSPTNAPAPSPLGEAVLTGTRKINDLRHQRNSATAFGRTLTLNRREIPTTPQDTLITEDWTPSTPSLRSTASPSSTEDWTPHPRSSSNLSAPNSTPQIESW